MLKIFHLSSPEKEELLQTGAMIISIVALIAALLALGLVLR